MIDEAFERGLKINIIGVEFVSLVSIISGAILSIIMLQLNFIDHAFLIYGLIMVIYSILISVILPSIKQDIEINTDKLIPLKSFIMKKGVILKNFRAVLALLCCFVL